MIHWRALDTAGKISAIAGVYEPGMSASHIAANFEGATRNAIIGLYHRHREKLTQWPLLPHGQGSNPTERPRKARAQSKAPAIRRSVITGLFMTPPRAKPAPKPIPAPLPRPVVVRGTLATVGKPMMMLKANECRWAVNDAAKDELHLFCSMPTEASYCHHHAVRAVQQVKT